MKRKKIFSIAALVLGATLFTACTNVDHKVTFSQYWNYDVNVAPTNAVEELTYAVSFEQGSGITDNGLSLSYSNGVYTTKLSTQTVDDKVLYYYETELKINVTYQLGEEKSATLADSVKSTVLFERPASINEKTTLRPLSSHKEVVSHSPVNGEIASVDEAYAEYDYTVDVTYELDGTAGKAVVTNNQKQEGDALYKDENTFEIDTEDYDYLDNEQLLFALRCLNPSQATAAKFLVYAPFSQTVQTVSTAFPTSASVANFKGITMDGETIDRDISYYPVTIEINATNSGSSHLAWIAKTTNASANAYRNVMLRYEAPVSYSLGTLIYELKTAKFTSNQ